ncbi:DUF3014 domain-containing protein [Shewanella gaetbuli]
MQVTKEDRATPTSEPKAAPNTALIGIVVVLVIAAATYFYINSQELPPEPVEPIPVQLPEPVPAEPIEQAPIEEPIIEETIEAPSDTVSLGEPETPVVEAEPLPDLSESDDFMEQKALAVADGMKIDPLIIKKDMARQLVVFVDNLAQGEVIRKASPLKGPESNFTVSEITNKTYLNPDSYHRYDLYADFISGLDKQQLANTYQELAPLFEQAFDELGYSDLPFDERMQQVFKMVLDAPIIEDPIELTSISVNYQFADPNLEALPNAQKLLIRMGPKNTRKIKDAVKKLQPLIKN